MDRIRTVGEGTFEGAIKKAPKEAQEIARALGRVIAQVMPEVVEVSWERQGNVGCGIAPGKPRQQASFSSV
jgi:hypothetical protein